MQTKNRKCSYCKKKVPAETAIRGGLRAFCSMEHLMAFTKSEAGQKVVRKAVRQDTKEQLERMKSRSQWLTEAQRAFNAWIRWRDRKDACISCGEKPSERVGGAFDAGHYIDVGDAGRGSYRRFDTNNVHAQCKKCNRFSNSGVKDVYRKQLIAKIGLEKVEELESVREQKRFNVEKLKRIKAVFQKRLRINKKIVDR